MKSGKWKAIIIKDPKLRIVRENLRLLLKAAIDSRLSHLSHLEDLYRKKRISYKLTPSQWNREVSISKMINNLLHARANSILTCSEGSSCVLNEAEGYNISLEKDMVWNPIFRRWICIGCYNYFYATDSAKKRLVEVKDCIDNENAEFKKFIEELKK